MQTAILILGILLGAGVVLALVWMFLVFAKRPETGRAAPFRRAYAHRGLFGGEIPENSLPAFAAAAEKGFAIELDVQLSSDGEVMVFHDYTLSRMCGVGGTLSERTADELKKTPLAGTAHGIPSLREVLAVVGGRVPLLIELKGENGNTALCPRLMEVLAGYRGAWCVESFNPLLLRWFKKNAPQVLRGLLVTDLIREKKSGSKLLNFALSAQLLNFLCRPQFIAWDHHYPKSAARRYNIRRGLPSFVFTVKDEAEYLRLLASGDCPIFDSFLPTEQQM